MIASNVLSALKRPPVISLSTFGIGVSRLYVYRGTQVPVGVIGKEPNGSLL